MTELNVGGGLGALLCLFRASSTGCRVSLQMLMCDGAGAMSGVGADRLRRERGPGRGSIVRDWLSRRQQLCDAESAPLTVRTRLWGRSCPLQTLNLGTLVTCRRWEDQPDRTLNVSRLVLFLKLGSVDAGTMCTDSMDIERARSNHRAHERGASSARVMFMLNLIDMLGDFDLDRRSLA